jgi:Tol biopolymer transport system component
MTLKYAAPILAPASSSGVLLITAALLCGSAPKARPQATVPVFKPIASITPHNIYEAPRAAISPDGRVWVYTMYQLATKSVLLKMLDSRTQRARVLTPAPGFRHHPDWSPDGKLIAFGDNAPERAGLWLLDPATEKEWRIHKTAAGNVSGLCWTAAGELLFAVQNQNKAELWRVNRENGQAQMISSNDTNDDHPAMSPDGRQIAFLSARDMQNLSERALWIMPSEGGNARRLTNGMIFQSDHPVWSRDGKTIYFAACTASDPLYHAWAVHIEGGEPRRIENFEHDVLRASMTRNGMLALAVYEANPSLATVPVNGGVPRRVFEKFSQEKVTDAFMPVWSPDGRKLVFISGTWQRTGFPHNWDIGVVTLNDDGTAVSAPQILLAEDKEDYGAAFSPDGKWIAFHSHRGNTDDLYLRRADSSQARVIALSAAGFETGQPHWSPDGKRIGFSTSTPGNFQGQGRPFIVTINSATGEPLAAPDEVKLENFSGHAFGAAFSPDGHWLAFSAVFEDGSQGVCTVSVEGGEVRIATKFQSGLTYGAPAWSRDGRHLFFASNEGSGVFQIKRVTLADGKVITITRGKTSVMHPRLSPDGNKLAVTLYDVRIALWLQ